MKELGVHELEAEVFGVYVLCRRAMSEGCGEKVALFEKTECIICTTKASLVWLGGPGGGKPYVSRGSLLPGHGSFGKIVFGQQCHFRLVVTDLI